MKFDETVTNETSIISLGNKWDYEIEKANHLLNDRLLLPKGLHVN